MAQPAEVPRASAATLAKGALRRLATARLEPTPENYARAYAEESGQQPGSTVDENTGPASALAASLATCLAATTAWAQLVDRLAKNLQRGGRQWTAARRQESLRRVLDGSGSDANRLQQRLSALMTAWESDSTVDPVAAQADGMAQTTPSPAATESIAKSGAESAIESAAESAAESANESADESADVDAGRWPLLVAALESTLRVALPAREPRAAELAGQLGARADAVAREGALPEHVAAIAGLCEQARRLLGQGHRQVDELVQLCRELGEGMVELSEDDSWAKGQCEGLHKALDADLSLRGLRSAAVMLAETRQRQQGVQRERREARATLKQLIQDMLQGVADLGAHAGRFQQVTAQHAHEIEQADTLEGLAGVVQAMLKDTRTVQDAVAQSQERLQADGNQAAALEARVRELEGELKRLSGEVSTDVLTQVSNRRGLMQAFETESARCMRETGTAMAVGLIDINNFKRLNDTLGHAAGDVALKTLATAMRDRLRPVDHLARFGGEEFVVLMPGAAVDEASQVLSRLQRSLTEALFLHEGREVFVTFSAGVTAWRQGEALEPALERADEALYEAKRTGKNRTCLA